MSTSDFTDSTCWGGRPVARRVVDARVRRRLVVTGTVISTGAVDIAGAASLSCVLTDGTGEVILLFVGRVAIAGLADGVRCTVEGTVSMKSERLVVWNPRYRLDSPVTGRGGAHPEPPT